MFLLQFVVDFVVEFVVAFVVEFCCGICCGVCCALQNRSFLISHRKMKSLNLETDEPGMTNLC